MITTDAVIPTTKVVRRPRFGAIKRFLRSPKWYLFLVLALLTAVAAPTEGLDRVALDLISAMLAAAVVDLAIGRWRRGVWFFPDGALLTGMIVALVLSPVESMATAMGTAAIAIVSKYLLRTRWSNVFNPAALALVAAYFAFGATESWWGALPDLPTIALVILLGAGLFMADRVNKLPMAIAFLGAYFALFSVSAFVGNPAWVAEIFRSPDANAALFFAFIMLDDPPTSPVRYPDQICYGVIVAVVSYAVFLTVGAEYYLLAGVLVGNLWETLRRWDERPRAKLMTT
ncbi:MAG: RnfABCDGE type electron transport complex subunit D [Chloroflexota bacterium]